jgi:hypothetical protein
MWDSLGSTYVDAVTKTFPLHRVLVFALGTLLSLIAPDHEYKSLSESLIRLGLGDLTSLESGPLSKATVLNVFLGLGAALSGWAVARVTLRIAFECADNLASVRQKVKVAYDESPFKNAKTIADRKEALEFVNSSLEDSHSKIKAMATIAELLGGVGVTLLIGCWWGSWLDAVYGLAALVAAVIAQFRSVLIFLSDYLGPALSRALLLGRPPPSSIDVS